MSDPAAAIAAHHQRALLDRLVCPRCRGPLELTDPLARLGAIAQAGIACGRCGPVGSIDGYRPSFLERDLGAADRLEGLVHEPVELRLARLARSGDWREVPEGIAGAGVGSQLGGLVDGAGIRFELLAHPWSGRVCFQLGDETTVVDLHADEVRTEVVVLRAPVDETVAWSLSILESDDPTHDQVILHELAAYVPVGRAAPIRLSGDNRGNPYPARFEAMLRELPPDALVLDLGGGDRRHPDPRVFNLEYLPYRRVDLYGDGLSLPFADDTFDFVLSQAVLEHVPDPPGAVAEISRVLRPGAPVYAEFAFMQPLHAVPFHFFNITPHGARLLFEGFEQVDISSFGGLGETMRWFFRLLDGEGRLGPDAAGQVLGALDRLDAELTERELAMVSSAVAVVAYAPRAAADALTA
ncbi:MAG: methyltransferase domain-containing protein [Acidimicrobiia bacterium]